MTSFSARTRRISDWIGFTFFGVFTVVTLSKMPAAGILLAPTLLHELFTAVAFLIRDPPRAAARSLRARLSAYGGSFIILAFVHVTQRFYPHWMTATDRDVLGVPGLLLWLGGSIWTVYAIWHLRSAFSIEAEARRLVTSGPYGVARHPVYAGYLAQYAGMWLVFPTIPFALALLAWWLLMADRMRHEEAVLASVFPEYAAYRRRVGAVGSLRLRRPVSPQPAAGA